MSTRTVQVVLRLAQVLTVVLIVVGWQWAAENGHLNPLYYSKPSAIWDQLKLWNETDVLWSNVRVTLGIFVRGYVIGTVLGILLGAAIGLSLFFRAVTEPYIAFFNAMPRLVLLPLFVIWFGFGPAPKVILVVTVVVFLVAVNVAAGLREVPPHLVANIRMFGAGPVQLARQVYGPAIIVWVMSTSRMTVGYAFSATIAAEFIGAAEGMGYLLSLGQQNLSGAQVWGILIITSAIALAVDALLALVERRSTRWREV